MKYSRKILIEFLEHNAIAPKYEIIINKIAPSILQIKGGFYMTHFHQGLLPKYVTPDYPLDLLAISHYIYIVIKQINQLKHAIMKQPKIT